MRRTAVGGWTLKGVLLLAILASSSRARASGFEQVRELLRVEPGATCLDADQLVVEIVPLLEGSWLPSDLQFVVEGSALEPRRALLRVVREQRTVAERAFAPGPERCSHFHAAVGLAIALAINAAHDEERDRGRPWSVSAAGLWTYRVLPELAPGLEVMLRRALGDHGLLRAGAAGAFAFDETLGARGTFDATLLVARVDGCARAQLSASLRGDGCAGLLAGLLHVSGSEVLAATSSTVPWIALAAAAQLELELAERWALSLGLSGSFLLHRVQVGLADAAGMRGQTRDLGRVGLALSVGPVYYF